MKNHIYAPYVYECANEKTKATSQKQRRICMYEHRSLFVHNKNNNNK